MKNIKIALIALMSLTCMLFACRSSRPAISTTYLDSTFTSTRTVDRDTLITAPAAETAASIEVADILSGEFTQTATRSGQANVTIYRKGNTLQVDCRCDTLAIAAKLRDTYTDQRRQVSAVSTNTVEKRYVPWYTKVLAWAGAAAIVFKLGGLALKYFKPKS